ncbi:hypothetical protein HPB50_020438 [Hyalomma asiaticum]|uniref:Uncharacterized protein n=1 Tax=Hyalomma asiaticum TaxID=266040 RepID=A0ACB7S536_HYAAI|nr:hypothetical protein HPB50_020438 [Hyalomma asiaticum]
MRGRLPLAGASGGGSGSSSGSGASSRRELSLPFASLDQSTAPYFWNGSQALAAGPRSDISAFGAGDERGDDVCISSGLHHRLASTSMSSQRTGCGYDLANVDCLALAGVQN